MIKLINSLIFTVSEWSLCRNEAIKVCTTSEKKNHEMKSTWEMTSTRFEYESNSFGVEKEIENSSTFKKSLILWYIHVNDST